MVWRRVARFQGIVLGMGQGCSEEPFLLEFTNLSTGTIFGIGDV